LKITIPFFVTNGGGGLFRYRNILWELGKLRDVGDVGYPESYDLAAEWE
jgi:hypothetical protein